MMLLGKSDLWHDYHACPLARKCPSKPLILSSVISATSEFVTEDANPIQEFVEGKLGYEDWKTHFKFKSGMVVKKSPTCHCQGS
jgi:hypothetical protein